MVFLVHADGLGDGAVALLGGDELSERQRVRHAAGWYAFAYLGEELTREETLERMDELLGLERVA